MTQRFAAVFDIGRRSVEMMKRAGRYALVLGTGYLLGRQRKVGTVLVLGAAVAAGRLSGNSGAILRKGVQALGGSTDLGKVLDLGGPLVSAGKAAAVSAVSSRIDSVSDRLQDRAETLRGRDRADDETGRRRSGRRADETDETPDADNTDDADDADEFDDEPEPPQARPTRAAQKPSGDRARRPAASRADRAGNDGDDDEEPEAQPRRPATRSRPTANTAPVRRRGR
jgi:hypothetical protein